MQVLWQHMTQEAGRTAFSAPVVPASALPFALSCLVLAQSHNSFSDACVIMSIRSPDEGGQYNKCFPAQRVKLDQQPMVKHGKPSTHDE